MLYNARRYGKAGGEIVLSLIRGTFPDSGEDAVILTVRDDGIGIVREDRDKIFDRFWRSDASRSIPGTGLGLSMVKSVADLHGAKIAMTHPVESERITLQECLEMNTSEAAKLGFLENRKGRLAFGLDADFIVLDQDPYAVETDALDGIKIEKTFRGGRCVFDAEDRKPHKKRSLPGVLLRIAGKKLRLPVG